MEKLPKNCYQEILDYLNLAEFFRVKFLNSKLRKSLEDCQHSVFKREAFKTFFPLLFDAENPFINSDFSLKELKQLISKQPQEKNEKTKEYILFIRSIVRLRKSLKNLAHPQIELDEFESSPNSQDDMQTVLPKFVDDIIFQKIRYPSLPLPQNRDEIMQNVSMTYLQEYLYAQYGNQARKIDDFSFHDFNSSRSSVVSISSPIKYRKISDLTRYVNEFFLSHQDQMKKYLLRPENEQAYKRFYYLRWYQIEPNLRDDKKAQILSSGLNRNLEPCEILLGLIEGLSDILCEQCDFISQIIFSDYNPKSQPVQLIEFYCNQWKSYSDALIQLDGEFSTISSIVNSLYSLINKDDEKFDYDFSILKLGMINWRYRVYKKNKKILFKSAKSLTGQFQKLLLKSLMKAQESSTSSDSDSDEDEDSMPSRRMGIMGYRQQNQKKDLIKSTIYKFQQCLLDLSVSPTNVFYLGSTKFITEGTQYDKYARLITNRSSQFFDDDLCPNKDLQDNLKVYLSEIEDLTIKSVFRVIEKGLTEKALNLVKDKIKQFAAKIINKMKKEGQSIGSYSKRDDENCLFQYGIGQYIKSKSYTLPIQQKLVEIISNEEQYMFNCVYISYLQSKRKYQKLDERFLQYASSQKIQYDKNDCSMSKRKYRYAEVRNDLYLLLRTRNRGSLKQIQLGAVFQPTLQKGRSSLVPFKLTVATTSEAAKRRSDLFQNFGSLHKESAFFNNSSLAFEKILDFFQGASSFSQGQQTQQQDELPSFQNVNPMDFQQKGPSSKKSILLPQFEQNNSNIQTKQRSSSLPNKAQNNSNEYKQQLFEQQFQEQHLDISQDSASLTRNSPSLFAQISHDDNDLIPFTPIKSLKDEEETKEKDIQ